LRYEDESVEVTEGHCWNEVLRTLKLNINRAWTYFQVYPKRFRIPRSIFKTLNMCFQGFRSSWIWPPFVRSFKIN